MFLLEGRSAAAFHLFAPCFYVQASSATLAFVPLLCQLFHADPGNIHCISPSLPGFSVLHQLSFH